MARQLRKVSGENPAQPRRFVLRHVALADQFPHRGGVEVHLRREEAPARHFACSFPAGSASPQLELGDPSRTAGEAGAEATSDGSLYRSMYPGLFCCPFSPDPGCGFRRAVPEPTVSAPAGCHPTRGRRSLFALARVKTFSELPGLDEQTVGIELVVEPIAHPPRPRWAAAGRPPEPR